MSLDAVETLLLIEAYWKRTGVSEEEKILLILGLKGSWKSQTEEDVRKKFLKLAKELHPDKVRNELSNRVFPIFKSAYDRLMNDLKGRKKTVPEGFISTVASQAVEQCTSIAVITVRHTSHHTVRM